MCYTLIEQLQHVTVFISAVSRLPFTVIIHVTLTTTALTSEQSRSTIQREVQDLVSEIFFFYQGCAYVQWLQW